MPWNHRATRSTVIDKYAGLYGFEAKCHFLPRRYFGQFASAHRTRGCVEINIVQ